jgi:hypothetical protein
MALIAFPRSHRVRYLVKISVIDALERRSEKLRKSGVSESPLLALAGRRARSARRREGHKDSI